MSLLETPKTFTLITPIDDVKTVTLREPNGNEFINFVEEAEKFGGAKALVTLQSRMSGVDHSVFLKMGVRDLAIFNKYINSFLEYVPQEG